MLTIAMKKETEMSTYHNPFWVHSFPDPFVLKVRGRYYAYATEDVRNPAAGTQVFPILTSTDLVHWQFVDRAMPALGLPYHWYWAPEVTFQNGLFFLYYAVHRESEFTGGIRVAVAERPEGPFIDSGHDLTGAFLPWAIDPHVFRDQDGQCYLYMTIDYWNDPGGFVGSGNAVARLLDPFTLDGQITRVTPPAHRWQLFEAQRKEKGGVDWYTVEGPAVLRHRERYYEMFSGGCYYRNNYAMSYATSATPSGPGGMHDASWQDWAGPQGNDQEAVLVRGDEKHLISPGHNSLVVGPNNVDLYLAYHAQQAGTVERRPCIDRLFWHGDELWTGAPTYTPQPAPALPRIRDLFEQSTLSTSWQSSAGIWRIADEAVIQQDQTVEVASLRADTLLKTAWILEINARHEAGDGGYGVLLQGQTGDTNLRVLLTPDARLVLYADHSPAQPIWQTRLPEQSMMQAWHQILLEMDGSLLCVRFDGVALAEIPLLEIAHTFRHFTLYTERCSAAFSGISLTDHFHCEFLQAGHTPELLGWQAQRSPELLTDWRIADGALHQSSSEEGEHLLLKNLTLVDFECGATMRLQETYPKDMAAFGITIWHERERYWQVQYTQQQGSWVLVLNQWEQSVCSTIASMPLASTFDPGQWHTLHLLHEKGILTVHADGPALCQIALSGQATRLGLHTHHAAATCMDVWQTGLAGREATML